LFSHQSLAYLLTPRPSLIFSSSDRIIDLLWTLQTALIYTCLCFGPVQSIDTSPMACEFSSHF
jgi:hypothetical protein